MSKKALEAALKTATEAYKEAYHAAYKGIRNKHWVYDEYFSAIYAIEGMVDMLCSSEEKEVWTDMVDKQRLEIRKLLKL